MLHTYTHIYIVAIYTKTIYIVDDKSYLILSSIQNLKSTNDSKVQKMRWLTSIILTERNDKRFFDDLISLKMTHRKYKRKSIQINGHCMLSVFKAF